MAEALSSVEIRVDRISQLFETLDPFPHPQRDLAETTEKFIVSWARELPKSAAIGIVVHLPAGEATAPAARQLGRAFAEYFRSRADRLDLDRRELFRIGRRSLVIGLAVLAGCLIAGRSLGALFEEGYLRRFFDEGLIILGWVANWRPIEIFLYDWWPLVRQRELYRRLALARVEIRTVGASAAGRPESSPQP